MSVSIIVGTYGNESWANLARSRAIPSAERQESAEVIHIHGESLSEVRNEGARRAQGETLVFVDADDELALGYTDAILKASGMLRTPAVQWVKPEGEEPPMLIPPTNLFRRNYLVIGTAIPRDLFFEMGGFGSEPCYEDWALFLRCWLAGATIEQVPDAIYRAWWNPIGRNSTDRYTAVYTKRAVRRVNLNAARRMGVA